MSTTGIFIAMPVFNGAVHIGESLRSIADQTIDDYRVVMSVDGPNDPTIDACRSWTRDPRFELVVQPEHLGWRRNFNWLARQCDREYFCYWQQDDLASTNYLEVLRAELVRRPAAAIAHTDVQWFGREIGRDSAPSVEGRPVDRLLERIEQLRYEPLRGLMRSAMLPMRPDVIPESLAAGHMQENVFLAEMAVAGDFVRTDAALYFKRAHRDNVHTRWLSAPADERRAEWLSMGVGLLRVGLDLVTVEDRGRLLATIVDRLTVDRPGRGFFLDPTSDSGVTLDVVRDVARLAAIDLTGDAWTVSDGTGFERPIHRFVRDALASERQRLRTLDTVLARDRPIRLEMGEEREGLAALTSGWSFPESQRIWTDGDMAHIDLPGMGPATVVLRGQPFAPEGPTRIGLSVGGGPILWRDDLDGEMCDLSFDVDLSGRADVRLHLPGCVSPWAVGLNRDDRQLGFALNELIIR